MAEDEALHLPLTDRAVRQIARDFAARPKDSCNTLLRRRPLHYLGKYTRSARNRFNYLKRLKAEKPDKYLASLETLGTEDELINYIPGEDDDEQEADEKELSVEHQPDSVPSFSPHRIPSTPPTYSTPRKTQQSLASPPSRASSTSKATPSSILKNRSPSTSYSHYQTPSPRKTTSNMSNRRVMFDTLDEAVAAADDVIYIDDFETMKPENNSHGFFIQYISEIVVGTELIKKLKISVPDIMDLRDHKKWTGHLVCAGAAFLIKRPILPHFFLQNHKEVLALEATVCERTETRTKKECTDIINDDTRQFRTILVVLPTGIAASEDFSMSTPSGVDKKCKFWLRLLKISSAIGKKKSQTDQFFYPCYWEMRILKGLDQDILENNNDSDSDIEDALEGMADTISGLKLGEKDKDEPTPDEMQS